LPDKAGRAWRRDVPGAGPSLAGRRSDFHPCRADLLVFRRWRGPDCRARAGTMEGENRPCLEGPARDGRWPFKHGLPVSKTNLNSGSLWSVSNYLKGDKPAGPRFRPPCCNWKTELGDGRRGNCRPREFISVDYLRPNWLPWENRPLSRNRAQHGCSTTPPACSILSERVDGFPPVLPIFATPRGRKPPSRPGRFRCFYGLAVFFPAAGPPSNIGAVRGGRGPYRPGAVNPIPPKGR